MNHTQINFIDKILAKTFLLLLPEWVTPNQLTILRLVLIVPVVWLLLNGNYAYGLPLFLFAMFTDALDGAQARTQNKITTFGKIMDPVADKLLIGIVALIVILEFANPYLAYTIIGLEVFLISSGLFAKFILKQDVQAEITGKIKVVVQTVGVGFLLAFGLFGIPILLTIGVWSLYAAIGLALVSLIVYRAI